MLFDVYSYLLTRFLAFERHARAKRARTEATNAMGVDVQTGSRQLQRTIASTSRNIESNMTQVVAEVCSHGSLKFSVQLKYYLQSSKLLESAELYQRAASERISAARQATQTLMEQGAQEDAPT